MMWKLKHRNHQQCELYSISIDELAAKLCDGATGQRPRWSVLTAACVAVEVRSFHSNTFPSVRHRQKESVGLCGFTPRRDRSSFKLLFFHTSPPLPPLTSTPRLKTQARFHPHRSVSAAYCFFFFFSFLLHQNRSVLFNGTGPVIALLSLCRISTRPPPLSAPRLQTE